MTWSKAQVYCFDMVWLDMKVDLVSALSQASGIEALHCSGMASSGDAAKADLEQSARASE